MSKYTQYLKSSTEGCEIISTDFPFRLPSLSLIINITCLGSMVIFYQAELHSSSVNEIQSLYAHNIQQASMTNNNPEFVNCTSGSDIKLTHLNNKYYIVMSLFSIAIKALDYICLYFADCSGLIPCDPPLYFCSHEQIASCPRGVRLNVCGCFESCQCGL